MENFANKASHSLRSGRGKQANNPIMLVLSQAGEEISSKNTKTTAVGMMKIGEAG